MTVVRLRLGLLLTAILPAAGAADAQPAANRWEPAVAAFEAADRTSLPPKGAIVFVGSSSIALWNVASSFPDLTIINRGIGGTEMSDAVTYVDRLVTPHEPRLVLVYAGDNDIAGGKTSEQVAIDFERFVARVHAKLPETRVVFVAVKPSILRWKYVDRMRSANAMIRAFCERDDRVAFVDIDGAMLGWDEKPRPELFVEDGLHLSAAGYQLWTTMVRPFLAAPPGRPGVAARGMQPSRP